MAGIRLGDKRLNGLWRGSLEKRAANTMYPICSMFAICSFFGGGTVRIPAPVSQVKVNAVLICFLAVARTAYFGRLRPPQLAAPFILARPRDPGHSPKTSWRTPLRV